MKILWRSKFTPDVNSIFEFADTEEVGAMVLGWPANMDGSAGPRCDSVRDFAHAMMRIRDIPVVFQDERFSTQAVESAMIEADCLGKTCPAPRRAGRGLDTAIGT